MIDTAIRGGGRRRRRENTWALNVLLSFLFKFQLFCRVLMRLLQRMQQRSYTCPCIVAPKCSFLTLLCLSRSLVVDVLSSSSSFPWGEIGLRTEEEEEDPSLFNNTSIWRRGGGIRRRQRSGKLTKHPKRASLRDVGIISHEEPSWERIKLRIRFSF